MSFIPVLQYVVGIAVLGFTGWLLNGLLDTLIDAGIHVTGDVFNLMSYVWTGIFVIYLVFGGWWVVR